jgi:CDP-diacylglycerol--glycerol-3-phosphate 3-phosphatidyltransferase
MDFACSIGVLALLLLVGALYGVRVMVSGVATFERVEKDQGSALLGRSTMQMGYWALDHVGRWLVALGATANGVSIASLLFGIGAGVALAFGHFGLGAALAVVSGLGDTLDGIVARRTKTASDAGEVLDAAVDRYEEFFFLGGIVVHERGNAVGVSLVLSALLGSFMVSYATAKAEALRAEVPRGAMRRPERAAYLIAGAAITPLVAPFARPLSSALGSLGAELPILIAVALVALVANVSAVRRLSKLARAVGGPRPASVATTALVEVAPASPASPVREALVAAPPARESSPPRAHRDAEALVHVDAPR